MNCIHIHSPLTHSYYSYCCTLFIAYCSYYHVTLLCNRIPKAATFLMTYIFCYINICICMCATIIVDMAHLTFYTGFNPRMSPQSKPLLSRYLIGEIWVVQGYVERQNWNIINIYFSPGIHALGVKTNYNALL